MVEVTSWWITLTLAVHFTGHNWRTLRPEVEHLQRDALAEGLRVLVHGVVLVLRNYGFDRA